MALIIRKQCRSSLRGQSKRERIKLSLYFRKPSEDVLQEKSVHIGIGRIEFAVDYDFNSVGNVVFFRGVDGVVAYSETFI